MTATYTFDVFSSLDGFGAHTPHPFPRSSPSISREPVGKTTHTDSCSQHTRAGRRGGHRKVGLEAHRARNGLPNLRSQEAPVPGQPTVRTDPDNNLQASSFIPRDA